MNAKRGEHYDIAIRAIGRINNERPIEYFYSSCMDKSSGHSFL